VGRRFGVPIRRDGDVRITARKIPVPAQK